MPDVTPGDGSYEETLARIAQIIRSEEKELGRIEDLSTNSFREWLSDVAAQISAQLGIALSSATALVVDVFTIGLNATSAFAVAYRKNYESARRIKRVR